MSIICLNLNDASILRLLEMGFLQELVSFPFDFSDEETGEYYITWVKGLALRVTPATLEYFVGEKGSPLLERVCGFYNHPDSMVSTAARTAAISLIRRKSYTDKHPQIPQLLQRIEFLPNLTCLMRDLLQQIHSDVCSLQYRGIRNKLEDLVDTLYYCKDLILVRDSAISADMETALFYYIILPVTIGTFVQDHMQPERLATQVAVGMNLVLLDLFKGEHCGKVMLDCLIEDKLPIEFIETMMGEVPKAPENYSSTFRLGTIEQSPFANPAFERLQTALFSSCSSSEFGRNTIFTELLDLFRSKHASLLQLLLILSDLLLNLDGSGESESLKNKQWRLVQMLVAVFTDAGQSRIDVLIAVAKIIERVGKQVEKQQGQWIVKELTAGVGKVRERMGLETISPPDVIALISTHWKDLKSQWDRSKSPTPLDLLSIDPSDSSSVSESMPTSLQHFMLLCNLKADLTASESAFRLSANAPIFLSYRSSYEWTEGETYEVPVSSMFQCVLYFGALRQSQVVYIMDDDYFFILLKPNLQKLGVAEVVYFQELTATSFQLARENSHRLLVKLLREKPVDVVLRFDEPAKAWDVLESLHEKQQQAEAFEKSLVNSLLLE